MKIILHVCVSVFLIVGPGCKSDLEKQVEEAERQRELENSPEFQRKKREAARPMHEGTTEAIKALQQAVAGKESAKTNEEESEETKEKKRKAASEAAGEPPQPEGSEPSKENDP